MTELRRYTTDAASKSLGTAKKYKGGLTGARKKDKELKRPYGCRRDFVVWKNEERVKG